MCFLYSLTLTEFEGFSMCRVHMLFFFFFFFFFETLKCARINDTSRVIRNPNILHMRKQRRRCCNRAADRRLNFCYIDTIFPLFLNQKCQPLAIFCGSTARFVSDLVGYHRIQVLAENLFPHDMFFFFVVVFFFFFVQ